MWVRCETFKQLFYVVDQPTLLVFIRRKIFETILYPTLRFPSQGRTTKITSLMLNWFKPDLHCFQKRQRGLFHRTGEFAGRIYILVPFLSPIRFPLSDFPYPILPGKAAFTESTFADTIIWAISFFFSFFFLSK